MRHIFTILIFALFLALFSGCISDPGFDKTKFEDLGRTAQALRTAITSSSPCNVPQDLEQQLASDIAAAGEKAASKPEQNVVAAYSRLLSAYRDGLLLCRSRGHLANFGFLPKGRIVVSQDVDPLVRKYGLPTDKHRFKDTDAYIYSIDAHAIDVVWEAALAQIKSIEAEVKYR